MKKAQDLFERVHAFIKDDRGAAAIVLAMMLPFLIAGLAFGAEVGFWELQRRKVQNAADMAAHSAALQLERGVYDKSKLKDVAVAVSTFAGYNGGDADATVETPPTGGAYAGDTLAVRVLLVQSLDRRFSSVFAKGPVRFQVLATALIAHSGPACVLALDPTASGAVSIGGSTDIDLTGCKLAANSTSSSAIETTGASADLSAECIATPGGVDDSHGGINLACGDPQTGVKAVHDPYGDLQEPPAESCVSFTEFTKKNQTTNPDPGCYSVNGNKKVEGDVILKPGTYVFTGSGQITLNGTNSLTGVGVTLFFDDDVSLKVNGDFVVDIKAPTSGDYSGIAIFGSRTNGGEMDLTGNSGVSVVGAIYAPSSNVIYTGNTSGFTAGECTQLVAGTVTFWGNSDFNTDCSGSGTDEIFTSGGVQLVE